MRHCALLRLCWYPLVNADCIVVTMIHMHGCGCCVPLSLDHGLIVAGAVQLRRLEELPPDVAPMDFPRPARGSQRAERAAQAHALNLAEAKVGNRWWAHLRALNTQARLRGLCECGTGSVGPHTVEILQKATKMCCIFTAVYGSRWID